MTEMTEYVGETTEEIPPVPIAPGDESGELFGAAGSLRGLRFNGRTLVRAIVFAVWAVGLAVVGLFFYVDLAELSPAVPRWWVLLCSIVLAAFAVVVLSDVDEPDVEDGSAGHEFHELDWSRKELYALRSTDLAWALVELAPLVAILVTIWR
ncbi:MAG: hypothetical protein DYH08_08420 [Actinobacteria bacterium ATB1]|nr:hypothetical protein [Actinobacteria bacterium ATB1]